VLNFDLRRGRGLVSESATTRWLAPLQVGRGQNKLEIVQRLFQRLSIAFESRVREHVHLVDHETLKRPYDRFVNRLQQLRDLVTPRLDAASARCSPKALHCRCRGEPDTLWLISMPISARQMSDFAKIRKVVVSRATCAREQIRAWCKRCVRSALLSACTTAD
jgi:hypothetical protein